MRVDGREPIPRLEDLLEALPDVRVNIDCKTDRAVAPLVDVLRRTATYDRVCVGSFNDLRLRRLRRSAGPTLCSSAGRLEVTALRVVGINPGGALAMQVPVNKGPVTVVTPRFVERAHRRGLAVHVWTIDEPAEMRRLLDLGVDGIMTDRPAVLREILAERGQWT